MKLAFSGEGRYPDFDEGYELYVSRSKKGNSMDRKTYAKVVKEYCRRLAERLYEEGMVDLPCGIGSISAATFRRKPMYRNGKFDGFGAMDWKTGHRNGKIRAFGLVYLPRMDSKATLRCYGFVGNRRLFKRMKELYEGYGCPWVPIDFKDEMI